MKVVLIIIFVLILLFLHIGVFPHLKIAGSFPNLIVLAILGLSIFRGWKKALPWIIIGGLFLDFYSLHRFLGISVVSLFAASYLIYILSQNFFKEAGLWSLAIIFLIGIFVYQFFLIILFAIFGISFNFMILGFFIGIIYNLVFALPIFFILKKYVS